MKIITKIIISILLSFFIFIIADIIFFYSIHYQGLDMFASQLQYRDDISADTKNSKIKLFFNFAPKYFIKLQKFEDVFYKVIKPQFRPIQNPDSQERPIMIFGCSCAYGYIFDNKETISYAFSKYSKRPIINKAYNGFSIQHMLYQLKNDKDICESYKNPKYVFYVLLDNDEHFKRMYFTNFCEINDPIFYLTYVKNKKGELTERKPFLNMYYGFAMIRHIENKKIMQNAGNAFYNNNPSIFNFFLLHLQTINNLIKQKWGNDTKFIILTFEGTKKELWEKQANEMGIDVVDIADTIGYKNLPDSKYGFYEPEIAGHPNGKLWALLVPKLKEKYPDL